MYPSVVVSSMESLHQFQGQMVVATCDFVVWTPLSFLVITLAFDESSWKNHWYPTLKMFLYHASRNSLSQTPQTAIGLLQVSPL